MNRNKNLPWLGCLWRSSLYIVWPSLLPFLLCRGAATGRLGFNCLRSRWNRSMVDDRFLWLNVPEPCIGGTASVRLIDSSNVLLPKFGTRRSRCRIPYKAFIEYVNFSIGPRSIRLCWFAVLRSNDWLPFSGGANGLIVSPFDFKTKTTNNFIQLYQKCC